MEGETKDLEVAPGNPFWDYSLEVYQRRNVAGPCMALQDRLQLDVNLLLFCCWTGAKGHQLSEQQIREALAATEVWQGQVVAPLRRLRRLLKTSLDMAPARRQAFRDKLKDLEWLIGDWKEKGDGFTIEFSCQWTTKKNFIRNLKVREKLLVLIAVVLVAQSASLGFSLLLLDRVKIGGEPFSDLGISDRADSTNLIVVRQIPVKVAAGVAVDALANMFAAGLFGETHDLDAAGLYLILQKPRNLPCEAAGTQDDELWPH